jgi:nitrate reductase delta subunit
MSRNLYRLFAELVEDPTPLLSDRVNKCTSLLIPFQREAADLMRGFKTFLHQTSLDRMEQIYTRTFDLPGICYPYVGYHLFGDGSHRRMFLSGLKEHYKVRHFFPGNELPDHLGVMLRFLASNEDEEEREELIFLCIIPALKKMLEGFEDGDNPYEGVLRALLLTVQSGTEWKLETGTTNVDLEEFQCER